MLTVNGKAYVVNPASLLNQESLTEEEAIVETRPLVPVKAKPWDRDDRKRLDEMVDDAVEKNPLSRPRVVEVEAPYEVNGSM